MDGCAYGMAVAPGFKLWPERWLDAVAMDVNGSFRKAFVANKSSLGHG